MQASASAAPNAFLHCSESVWGSRQDPCRYAGRRHLARLQKRKNEIRGIIASPNPRREIRNPKFEIRNYSGLAHLSLFRISKFEFRI
jgi:hypothetical protein